MDEAGEGGRLLSLGVPSVRLAVGQSISREAKLCGSVFGGLCEPNADQP